MENWLSTERTCPICRTDDPNNKKENVDYTCDDETKFLDDDYYYKDDEEYRREYVRARDFWENMDFLKNARGKPFRRNRFEWNKKKKRL
jgi:hypothetical protein